jgi:hypothetical protein
MAEAVSHWPLTTEVSIHAHVSPCGICGGQSGTRTKFLPSSLVFHHQYYSTTVLHTHILSRGLKTDLLLAAVQMQSHSININKLIKKHLGMQGFKKIVVMC